MYKEIFDSLAFTVIFFQNETSRQVYKLLLCQLLKIVLEFRTGKLSIYIIIIILKANKLRTIKLVHVLTENIIL